jgi:hypothetical protein
MLRTFAGFEDTNIKLSPLNMLQAITVKTMCRKEISTCQTGHFLLLHCPGFFSGGNQKV